MVRNRLLQQCDDHDNLGISTTFTFITFKQFISLANNPDTNKMVSSTQIIPYLKKGKPAVQQQCIDKFGEFFVQEYKHFINMNNIAIPSQFSDRISEARLPNIQALNQQEQVVFKGT